MYIFKTPEISKVICYVRGFDINKKKCPSKKKKFKLVFSYLSGFTKKLL